jgi:hypothetical protein
MGHAERERKKRVKNSIADGTYIPPPTPHARSLAAFGKGSFRAERSAGPSGHNGHSGVARAIGGDMINVPAVAVRMPSPRHRRRPPATKKQKNQPSAIATERLDLIDLILKN